MDIPTRNYPLMRKVLDHVTAHPEEHNQNEWAMSALLDRTPADDYCRVLYDMLLGRVPHTCDTTACLAGWAVIFSDPAEVERIGVDETNTWRLVPDIARDLLGLTNEEAFDVFYTSARERRPDLSLADVNALAIWKLRAIADEEGR